MKHNQSRIDNWLLDLSIRAALLVVMAQADDDLESIEDELVRCNSILRQISELSRLHDINLLQYQGIMISIAQDLKRAEYILQKRKLSWWQRIVRAIGKAINVIGNLLGINIRIPLPGGDKILALPFFGEDE